MQVIYNIYFITKMKCEAFIHLTFHICNDNKVIFKN